MDMRMCFLLLIKNKENKACRAINAQKPPAKLSGAAKQQEAECAEPSMRKSRQQSCRTLRSSRKQSVQSHQCAKAASKAVGRCEAAHFFAY
jgi:hypothetical protein